MYIEERLERLSEKIKEKDFLEGKGLGNEVPFWIFDYPPENELLVRSTITNIIQSAKKQGINVCLIDLYKQSLEAISGKVSMEKIIQLENGKGTEILQKKLKLLIKPETIKREIQKKIQKEEYGLIFLTGVGKVWPLLRSHSILNNLQSIETGVPLVMFYPGIYSGNDLSLFGRFKDGNYYRAFRLIVD